MFEQPDGLTVDMPSWLMGFAATYRQTLDIKQRMQFVIAAAEKNIDSGTGGPFAAAVFEADSGKLIALGVNLVVKQGLSALHAEVVAMSLAERKLGSFNLAEQGVCYELYSSAEPCAMCLGAIPWSGVRKLVTAASDAEVRAIGFDEGSKPADWRQGLAERDIEVVIGVERNAANEVLQKYQKNGVIYNAKKTR